MPPGWKKLSLHSEYHAKLAFLARRHRRSQTSVMEILIDKALENDALVMPTIPASAVVPAAPGEANRVEAA